MMKETYRSMQTHIRPDEALIKETLTAAEQTHKPRFRMKYMGIAAAAACLVMAGSVPVLAANVPAFYDALYRISPGTAQFFKPIQMADEDQGIRMEVTAVNFSEEENSLQVYLTLQDLTSDRLNIESDLISIFRMTPDGEASSAVGGLRHVDYDENAGTMTILMEETYDRPDLNAGDKMTFRLQGIEGDKQTTVIQTGVELSDLVPTIGAWEENAPFVNGTSQSGSHPLQRRLSGDAEQIIQPSLDIALPADGIRMTGLGYIHQDTTLFKNECHIQLYKENPEFGKWVRPILRMTDGTELRYWGQIFTMEGYVDYLFTIKEDALKDAELYLEVVEYQTHIEGDWSVTFAIPEDAAESFPQGKILWKTRCGQPAQKKDEKLYFLLHQKVLTNLEKCDIII